MNISEGKYLHVTKLIRIDPWAFQQSKSWTHFPNTSKTNQSNTRQRNKAQNWTHFPNNSKTKKALAVPTVHGTESNETHDRQQNQLWGSHCCHNPMFPTYANGYGDVQTGTSSVLPWLWRKEQTGSYARVAKFLSSLCTSWIDRSELDSQHRHIFKVLTRGPLWADLA